MIERMEREQRKLARKQNRHTFISIVLALLTTGVVLAMGLLNYFGR